MRTGAIVPHECHSYTASRCAVAVSTQDILRIVTYADKAAIGFFRQHAFTVCVDPEAAKTAKYRDIDQCATAATQHTHTEEP